MSSFETPCLLLPKLPKPPFIGNFGEKTVTITQNRNHYTKP